MWLPDLAPSEELVKQAPDLSVGCYCADEARCHRSALRGRLREHGALLA